MSVRGLRRPNYPGNTKRPADTCPLCRTRHAMGPVKVQDGVSQRVCGQCGFVTAQAVAKPVLSGYG